MSTPDWDYIKARSKANKPPTASEYTLADWLIGADKVRDEHPYTEVSEDYFIRRGIGRTLKYVKQEIIDALAKVIPTVQVRYQVGPDRSRTTYVFPVGFIYYLLTEMKLNVGKYSRVWEPRFITRCRIDRENR